MNTKNVFQYQILISVFHIFLGAKTRVSPRAQTTLPTGAQTGVSPGAQAGVQERSQAAVQHFLSLRGMRAAYLLRSLNTFISYIQADTLIIYFYLFFFIPLSRNKNKNTH